MLLKFVPITDINKLAANTFTNLNISTPLLNSTLGILILFNLYKQILSYDRAKLKKVGYFYALTWLIFTGPVKISYHAFMQEETAAFFIGDFYRRYTPTWYWLRIFLVYFKGSLKCTCTHYHIYVLVLNVYWLATCGY